MIYFQKERIWKDRTGIAAFIVRELHAPMVLGCHAASPAIVDGIDAENGAIAFREQNS